MTAGSAAPTSAPAGAPPANTVALHRLVSRTRVLAPGEVDDLLDVIGQDGFAWIRAGAGFVTAGVAARLPVNSGPGRFAEAAEVVAEALQSITVDGPSPAGENCVPGAGPIAVGALPFDDRTPGSLVVPAVTVVRRVDGSGWVTVVGPRSDGDRLDPERITHRYGTQSAPAPPADVDFAARPLSSAAGGSDQPEAGHHRNGHSRAAEAVGGVDRLAVG